VKVAAEEYEAGVGFYMQKSFLESLCLCLRSGGEEQGGVPVF
jgi:hypothetical protein